MPKSPDSTIKGRAGSRVGAGAEHGPQHSPGQDVHYEYCREIDVKHADDGISQAIHSAWGAVIAARVLAQRLDGSLLPHSQQAGQRGTGKECHEEVVIPWQTARTGVQAAAIVQTEGGECPERVLLFWQLTDEEGQAGVCCPHNTAGKQQADTRP